MSPTVTTTLGRKLSTKSPQSPTLRKKKTIGIKPFEPTTKAYVPQSAKTRPSLNTVPQPKAPELPNQLSKIFENEPQNYPGLIPALSDEEHFKTMVSKWRQLGVLFATDIIRNSPGPVDYDAKIGQNDLRSGFGQLNHKGQLSGIGREVQDFIYEGQFKDNLYHGWGRYIDHTGVFWGTFERGCRNGRGKWVSHNGAVKEGHWHMG